MRGGGFGNSGATGGKALLDGGQRLYLQNSQVSKWRDKGLSCIGMDIQFRASDGFVCLTAMSGLSCIGMEMKFTAALDGRKNVLSGATVPLGILSAA